MEEASEEMRVVDSEGELDEDILVGQVVLLQRLNGEFALFMRSHKLRSETEGPE
jgi:hypothetical protein